MVAHFKSPHLRAIPPATIDPSEPLQDAFNPTTRKLFELKRTGLIQDPKTKRTLREFLLVDQFGNNWITFLAVCADMEVHQWPIDRSAYVKPSIMAEHGGLTADLFDKYRLTAFKVFARQDAAHKALQTLASRTAGKIVDVTNLELPPAPSLTVNP